MDAIASSIENGEAEGSFGEWRGSKVSALALLAIQISMGTSTRTGTKAEIGV